jgi:16S rRNA (guanine1207-N2)-methyltransferase
MADGERGDHYFTANPSAATRPSTVDLHLPDASFSLATDSGVFGRQQVDPGTKLLLVHGPAPTAGDTNLLDLGCGYGPIALTLGKRNPAASVWAVDINERALALCRHNAAAAGLHNVVPVRPEAVPESVAFDRIWSNPPIRIGKKALRDLLAQWLDRLAPQGSAHLVVQKHLGSDSLHRWLEESGWPTVRRRSQSAYRLLDIGFRETTPS